MGGRSPMISSHAADSAAAAYLAGGATSDTSGSGAGRIPCLTELAAIRALAEELRASPAQIDEFVQHAAGIPPRVLLSWICLWDLKRRNA